jgi:hypothetical protein
MPIIRWRVKTNGGDAQRSLWKRFWVAVVTCVSMCLVPAHAPSPELDALKVTRMFYIYTDENVTMGLCNLTGCHRPLCSQHRRMFMGKVAADYQLLESMWHHPRRTLDPEKPSCSWYQRSSLSCLLFFAIKLFQKRST